MTQSIFEHAAQWVSQRRDLAIPSSISASEIKDSIVSLYSMASSCKAAIMIPDLFPETTLEALYIPANDVGEEIHVETMANGGQRFTAVDSALRVTTPALKSIGKALVAQLELSGNDMVIYEFGDGAQAIAYLPDVRSTVLQATGLVLLNA